MRHHRHTFLFCSFAALLLLLFLVNICVGAVALPLSEVVDALLGQHNSSSTTHYIILHYRLPKAIAALVVGMGLASSGLLMQTLFQNPLAGPDVLGLSAGASLGVAILVLGASVLPPSWASLLSSAVSTSLAATIGSFLVLLAVLAFAQTLKSSLAILIVGLMLGSTTNAVVGTLTYLSSPQALQQYTFWSFGNLANLPWPSVAILACGIGLGLGLSVATLKSLNSLLLGHTYARSLGSNVRTTRLLIIFATSITTGCSTAFVGPIAFVGLAAPHLAKLIFQTSNHYGLFFASILLGALLLLGCDTLSHLPNSPTALPINVVTSLFGAPLLIWLLLKKPHTII